MMMSLLWLPAAHAQDVTVLPSVALVGDQARITIATTALPKDADRGRLSISTTINGVPAQTVLRDSTVATVTPQRVPVLLALDVSGSMGEEGISATREAISILVTELPTDVPLGLLSFNDTPSLLVAPTTDRGEIERRAQGLTAGGNTALHDAITLGLSTLGSGGRLVVLSDGEDTSSVTSRRDVNSAISESSVSLSLVTYNLGPQGQQAYDDLLAAAGARGTITSAELAEDLAQTLAQTVNSVETTLVLSATVDSGAIGEQVLDVQVTYGEVTLVGRTTFTIDPIAGAAARPSGNGLARTVVLGAVLLALGLALLVAALAGRTRSVDGSLAQIRHYSPQAVDTGGRSWAMDLIRTLLMRTGRRERIASKLDGAGLRFSPEMWVLLRVTLPLGLAVIFTLMIGGPLGVIAGLSLGILLPRLVVSFRRRRTKRSFEASLPDVLMLISGSLRVGFSLEQAIAGAAEDREDVVGSELRRALREMHVGSSLPEVLERVADRMDSNDFRWVVTTLSIQRRTGASLSELLEGSARTMRERTQLARDVRALTGEGRLSAWILGGLPFFIFAFLFLIRREYVTPLWTTPMGILLVMVGAVALGIGALWMRALIKVEV
jgi:Flp pilus assembly protein TadB/Mg-chelatase subunit ChlD